MIVNDYDNMKGYGLNLRYFVYYVRDIKVQCEYRNIFICCIQIELKGVVYKLCVFYFQKFCMIVFCNICYVLNKIIIYE